MITLTAIYWPRRYPTAALCARALRMLAEGLKSTTIARELGVHPNTVLNWLIRRARLGNLRCSTRVGLLVRPRVFIGGIGMTDMTLMKDIVLKIEAAEEIRRIQAARIQSAFALAERNGLDVAAIRELIRERATPGSSQPETTVDVYRRAMEA